MTENTKKLKKSLVDSIKYFNNQLLLLKRVVNNKLKGKAFEVRILLASSCTTGASSIILGKNPQYFYTEAMMLSRSFLEKMINFCYLQVCSKNEFENFLIHPWYRQYHNLNRSKSANNVTLGLKFSGVDSFKKLPPVQEALEKFSETNKKKNWSKKSIDEKVNIIAQKTKIDVGLFLINTLSIYSSASESLHGSLFGCSYHTGIYDPTINHKNKLEVHENILKNLILLYAQMGSLIHITIKILKLEKYDVDEILNMTSENQKNSISFLKKMLDER